MNPHPDLDDRGDCEGVYVEAKPCDPDIIIKA